MENSEFGEINQDYQRDTQEENQAEEEKVMTASGKMPLRTVGRRGRKPARLDTKVRLERSQQSARECRARKKLRYQYLEELVSSREKAIFVLRKELESYKSHCKEIDEGVIPLEVKELLKGDKNANQA